MLPTPGTLPRPWASIFGLSKTGIEGDGVITLILAIIGADMSGVAAIGLYLTFFGGVATWQ